MQLIRHLRFLPFALATATVVLPMFWLFNDSFGRKIKFLPLSRKFKCIIKSKESLSVGDDRIRTVSAHSGRLKVLYTSGLEACVAVVLYDPVNKVAGMVHMDKLPVSKLISLLIRALVNRGGNLLKAGSTAPINPP